MTGEGPPTVIVAFPSRPPECWGERLTHAGVRLLQVSACATLMLAPIEGYLMAVEPQLVKVPTVLLAASWAGVRLRQRRLPQLHPVHVLLGLLAAVVLTTSAVHAGEPFTTEYALRWLPFLAVTAILVDVAAREVPLRALLVAAVAGATVAGVGALFSFFVEGDARATGPLQDPNDLAYVQVAALPLLLVLIPRGSSHRGRRAPAVLAPIVATVLVVGVMATLSRGGILALLAVTGYLTVRRVLSVRLLVSAGALLAVAGVAGMVFAGEYLTRALDEKAYVAASNVDTRTTRWEAAARMLADNPLLGVGPGGFRSNYAAASHNAEIAEQTPVAHNMYLEVAAELGLPGLVLFLAVIACALVASERALRASEDPRPMIAIQAGLLGVLVASTFLSEQYYMSLWSLVAMACAADLRTRQGAT